MNTAAATQTSTGPQVVVRPLIEGGGHGTEAVLVNGRHVGEVIASTAVIGDRYYRFADRDAAVAAVVSAHLRGYWTGEL